MAEWKKKKEQEPNSTALTDGLVRGAEKAGSDTTSKYGM